MERSNFFDFLMRTKIFIFLQKSIDNLKNWIYNFNIQSEQRFAKQMNVLREEIIMISLLNRKGKMEKDLKKSAKIFGETIEVKIIYSKVKNPELDLVGNIINVYLPSKYKRTGNMAIVKLAIDKMYEEIARVEIEKVMEETRIMLKGLAPENYEIKRIPNKFAKTLQDKTIIINPEIVKYDKKVLRYVVLHEFCHLKYKTHSKGFFEMMERYMDNYEDYDYILNVA